MKSSFAILLAGASLLAGVNAIPQILPICDICSPTKPTCPAGDVPSGGPGCWGCCRPICRTIYEDPLSGIIIDQGCLPTGTFNTSPESDPPLRVCWQCCLTSTD
ncbi:hypothetical protein CPB84DRAFT_1762345 [Gymnopilus junonius]|uniref:Uncharacterized protein n=1 Tax=Gymnopilus junonius TaxID=109634 RepID=A0A9P5NZM0_GYMJU|nr:hypothetical protein CPB84DRAFT_1762345 [Gymnopilus junonius]